MVLVLSAIVCWAVSSDADSSAIDYISGIGSVASVYAVIIALIEIKSVKKTAKETQDAVKRKMKEVNNLLSYADVEKHVQMCSSINLCLREEQYEAVAMKLEELKKILIEIQNDQSIKEKRGYLIQPMVMRLGTDIVAVRNKWTELTDVDTSKVMEHVNEVATYLQDVSSKIKHITL